MHIFIYRLHLQYEEMPEGASKCHPSQLDSELLLENQAQVYSFSECPCSGSLKQAPELNRSKILFTLLGNTQMNYVPSD